MEKLRHSQPDCLGSSSWPGASVPGTCGSISCLTIGCRLGENRAQEATPISRAGDRGQFDD